MTYSSHPKSSAQSTLKSLSSQAVPSDSDDSSYRLAQTVAQAADDRKGADIVLLKVSDVSYLADYFVVVTGFSNVQVRAIASSIEDKVEQELQRRPLRVEGQQEGNWMLMDYGDVIVHIFDPGTRDFYDLEELWKNAPVVVRIQ